MNENNEIKNNRRELVITPSQIFGVAPTGLPPFDMQEQMRRSVENVSLMQEPAEVVPQGPALIVREDKEDEIESYSYSSTQRFFGDQSMNPIASSTELVVKEAFQKMDLSAPKPLGEATASVSALPKRIFKERSQEPILSAEEEMSADDFQGLTSFGGTELTEKERIKRTRRNIKELERELDRQKTEIQEMQNMVAEYVSRAEERFTNLSSLIDYQKELLLNASPDDSLLGKTKNESHEHLRSDNKWWRRTRPEESY